MLVPDHDELAILICSKFTALRNPYMQWANLARLAIQGLPYDVQQLVRLEAHINTIRAELRTAVILASEYFTDEQLEQLRSEAKMSKYAWRTLKKNKPITVKNGFWLISY